MEIEDIDRVVLNGFREEGQKHGCRASDVHGYFTRITGLDILRPEIEESIDRLLELHLIEESTEEMDFHEHYRPVSILEAIARAADDDPGRQNSRRPRGSDDSDWLPRGDVRRSLARSLTSGEPVHVSRRALARAQSKRRLWDAVADLLGLGPKA
jgi:hypothetical protein